MLQENLSAKSASHIFLACPTCASTMSVTSITPTCNGVIYGFLCSNDGDHISWRRRLKSSRD